MKLRLVPWLQNMWLSPRREALVREYAAVGAQHKLFLADIGLRGGAFSGVHVRGDDSATMVNVGRQELALEILEACGQDAQNLILLIEKPQKEKPNG